MILLLHPVTKEKTGVGWFVVDDVLPGDGETVLRVLDQGCNSVLGGNGCRVKAERLSIRTGHEKFFAPVSKDVAREAGAFEVTAGIDGSDTLGAAGFPVPFVDVASASDLTQQVSVPPNNPTTVSRCRTDVISQMISQSAGTSPCFVSGMSRINIRSHT